jgi:HEAT repeat protein/beta-lactamase regulating signal transducer with metallopeptidase domain
MTPVQLLGWTLLHFLWQGALIATVLAILLQLTRRLAPAVRYRLGLGALAFMALCPLVTADRLSQRDPRPAARAGLAAPLVPVDQTEATAPFDAERDREATASENPIVPAPAETGAVAVLRRRLEPWLPAFVAVWLAGVLLLSIRLLGGVSRARRLARSGAAPGAAHAAAFARLAQRLGLHAPVLLRETAALAVPAVIGWLRPVVLLPAAAAAGLTPQQLELLLAHELAHVRRNDYLVNLLQSVVETLLFYHPAVWWVSARVREEREHCCDDVALAACGNPREYAGALLALAAWRLPVPVPAAVGSGALLRRVRRILGQDAGTVELGPFWVSGLLAAGLALAVVGGVQATAAPDRESPTVDADLVEPLPQADPARARPDTIIRYTGQEDLARRWEWARATARDQRFEGYWVGYVVPVADESRPWQYLDRHVPVRAGDSRLSGHIRFTGSWNDLKFVGSALSPLLGERPPQDLVVLLGFAVDGNAARLARVHLSNWVFPVHFAGLPLLWLNESDDAGSVARLEALYGETGSLQIRKDLVSMVAAHAEPGAAVPALIGWLEGGDPDDLRAQAAEGLASYPVPEALRALDRAARTDRTIAVRAESIEALGEIEMPAATDALVELVDLAGERQLRAEAVEALGERHDEKALRALDALIQDDPDLEIQRAAVEALGNLPNGAGLRDLLDIAHRHRSYQVRAQAVETLGDLERPGEVMEALADIARRDPHPEVQRTAAETLGNLDDAAAVFPLLVALANEHEREDVQVAAVETLGSLEHPEAAAALAGIAERHPRRDVARAAVESLGSVAEVGAAFEALERIVWNHKDLEVQMEAAETIGELEGVPTAESLAKIVDRHPRAEVQMEAVEALGDQPEHAAAIRSLRGLIESHPSSELRQHAVDKLGEFEDPEVTTALLELARRHRDVEVRRRAVERLGEREGSESATVEALKGLVRDDPDPEVREEALEALADLHDGAGVPALIETARSHADRRVRVRAIELLGDSEDPRALEALRNIIRP